MTDTYRPSLSKRSVIASLGAFALMLGLLASYAPGAQAQRPSQGVGTDGSASAAQVNSPINLDRHAGPTRYETSAQIATDAYDASTDVVIASGEDFADALSGAALEGDLDAPVLLVPSDLVNGAIPTATTDAIDDLGATTATVLGGGAAVSDDVVDYIENNSTVQTTERVAGSTRFETAEQIAGEVGTAGSIPQGVADAYAGLSAGDNAAFLATGLNWPDAMAGSAGSFAGQHPILLTTPNELHPAADGGLAAANTDVVFILGGTGVISSGVASDLESDYEVVRLSGADRWETARNIADTFADDWGFGVQNVGLATGFAFADALASAPFLGNPAPLVLTPSNDTHATTTDFFTTRGCDIETIDIFGGDAAIEPSVAEDYAETACPDEPETLTLTPETAVNVSEESHTVTASVEDEAGDASDTLDGDDVYFTVLDGDGDVFNGLDNETQTVSASEAEFTYDGPAVADASEQVEHRIVACENPDYTTCLDDGDLASEVIAGEATKQWVEATTETTVQLNWQSEYRETVTAWGGVDDVAAATLSNDGNGTVDVRLNSDLGVVHTEGEVNVTSAIPDDGTPAGPNFHLHTGAIDAEGGVVIGLPTPELVSGDPAQREVATYDVTGTVVDSSAASALSDIEAAMDDDGEEVIDWYLNVHTVDNPNGEVRGQLQDIAGTGDPAADGGLSQIPAVYEQLDFVEETATVPSDLVDIEDPVESRTVEVEFDTAVSLSGTALDAGDFNASVDGSGAGISLVTDNPDGTTSIYLLLDAPLQDGEELEVTLEDTGLQKLTSAAGRDGIGDGDVTRSLSTRGFVLDAGATPVEDRTGFPRP